MESPFQRLLQLLSSQEWRVPIIYPPRLGLFVPNESTKLRVHSEGRSPQDQRPFGRKTLAHWQ